jgi:uncharacterized protein YecE (DUF72 family)
MRLHVGLPALRGEIAKYAQKFDLLELRAEPGTLPKPGRLREWRLRAPEQFVFSVALSTAVGTLEPGDAFESGLEYALRVADALKAGWIVLRTPASVMPSRRTERRLAELVARLPKEGCRIAWEPRGVWEDELVEALAARLGVHLVRDLRFKEAPSSEVVYARLIALGAGSRLSLEAAERVAERVAEKSEAYVVIEAEGAIRGAQHLREAVVSALELADSEEAGGRLAVSAGDADDDELEDDVGEGEVDEDDEDLEDEDDEDLEDEDDEDLEDEDDEDEDDEDLEDEDDEDFEDEDDEDLDDAADVDDEGEAAAPAGSAASKLAPGSGKRRPKH